MTEYYCTYQNVDDETMKIFGAGTSIESAKADALKNIKPSRKQTAEEILESMDVQECTKAAFEALSTNGASAALFINDDGLLDAEE